MANSYDDIDKILQLAVDLKEQERRVPKEAFREGMAKGVELALKAMQDGYGWRDLKGLPALIRQFSVEKNAGASVGSTD